MCKIGININATTPNGTSLTSTALGRYRPAGGGATDWVNFTISLANPETPNITQIGSYELQVNVTNNIAATSAWSNTATFSVSSNCTTTPVTSGACNTWELGRWPVISNFGGATVTYVDCNGITKTITNTILNGNIPVTFCARSITSVDLGGQPGTWLPYQITWAAEYKGLIGYLAKINSLCVGTTTSVVPPTTPIVTTCDGDEWMITVYNGNYEPNDVFIVDYIDCLGVSKQWFGQQNTIDYICVERASIPQIGGNIQGTVVIQGPCLTP